MEMYAYIKIIMSFAMSIWCVNMGNCDRRDPRNEAHDSTFGIFENYHCWRFHGSGVIAALQIIGLIFFCTDMHHEYYFRS